MIIDKNSKLFLIEKCFENIKNIIDDIFLINIDCSPKIIDFINKWKIINNMKAEILNKEWKNISFNRTESFVEAKNWLQNNNYALDKSYALFLDPDMKIQVLPKFRKSHFIEKSYKIKEFINDKLKESNTNIRFARFDQDWKCIGLVNEYWYIDNNVCDNYDHFEIYQYEDEILKNTKLIETKNLLEKSLIEEPLNDRYLFILSETYFLLKDYDNAYIFANKTLEKKGNKEEIWKCYLIITNVYLYKKDFENAFNFCIKAFDCNPERFDGFELIYNYCNENKLYHLSYFISDFAERLSNSKTKFIENKIYTGYRCDKITTGYNDCQKLLNDKDYNNKDFILEHLIYYTKEIEIEKIYNINNLKCSYLSIFESKTRNRLQYCMIVDNQIFIGEIENNDIISKNLIASYNNVHSVMFLDYNNIIINIFDLKQMKHIKMNIRNLQYVEKENSYIPIIVNTSKNDNITKYYINNKFPFRVESITNDSVIQNSLFKNLYKTIPKTNAIEFEGGFLMLLHVMETKRNIFYYRFLWISRNWSNKKL
jgi:tetratricopeptide (TPR) repeat protein